MKLPCECGVSAIEPLENPVFIADLHLSWRKIGTARRFFQFLRDEAPRFKELLILGDLFEFWVGDDSSFIALPVSRALRRYAEAGHKVYLMQGNRDVLLGEDFAERSGATLVRSSIAVTAAGHRILIAHGDEWCTLDTDYQNFRALSRSEEFQRKAFSMRVLTRIFWALKARRTSILHKKKKTQEQMDVVEAIVEECASALECCYVIHGHTHRPAVHSGKQLTRIVLPSWEIGSERKDSWGWAEVDPTRGPLLILK